MGKPSDPHSTNSIASRFARFLRAYRFEIVWGVVVAAGIFLILERMNIRAWLSGWLRSSIQALQHNAGDLGRTVAAFLTRTTLSDALGYLLVLGALAALLWRLRWRIMRAPALAELRCPRCRGNIHRVHRHRLDHLISLYVPVRRYYCTNSECRWRGLRVGYSHRVIATTRAKREPQAGS